MYGSSGAEAVKLTVGLGQTSERGMGGLVKEEGHDRDQDSTGVSKGTGLWICIQSQHVQRKAVVHCN